VSGHTDVTGSYEHNLLLSQRRAEAVKAYLGQKGIDAGRVSTKGEGGSVPLYPEGGTLGQYNDRVEIEFIKH